MPLRMAHEPGGCGGALLLDTDVLIDDLREAAPGRLGDHHCRAGCGRARRRGTAAVAAPPWGPSIGAISPCSRMGWCPTPKGDWRCSDPQITRSLNTRRPDPSTTGGFSGCPNHLAGGLRKGPPRVAWVSERSNDLFDRFGTQWRVVPTSFTFWAWLSRSQELS